MATRRDYAEMSIVWKFLVLYNLLEVINIDYQLKYEHATTRRL